MQSAPLDGLVCVKLLVQNLHAATPVTAKPGLAFSSPGLPLFDRVWLQVRPSALPRIS